MKNFSHFIKFYLIFLKKISKLLFTIDRSTLLFICNVQGYCSLLLFTGTVGHNTKIVLQHNLPSSLLPYNTIFQLPFLAIHSCILQYNFYVVCFATILQYNVAIQFPPSLAIQSLATTQPRLQYNFVLQLNTTLFLQYNSSYSSLLLYISKIVLQYNFLYCKPSLQYNPAIQWLAYLLYCNTILTLQAL